MVRIVGVLLVSFVAVQQAGAAEITVLCSNGLRAVMQDLVPEFERTSGDRVSVTYSVSAELKKRIDGGERFDLAVLTPALVDDLIRTGRAAADSRVVIARSGMALAVRRGSPKPDMSSVAALRTALIRSRSIAFAREGAGGVFFTALIQRLGVGDAIASTLKPLTTGTDVSQAVARGEAALGVLPLSEVLSAQGVELGGMFPSEVQDYAVMVGAVNQTTPRAANARALLTFLMAPRALQTLERRGMERVPMP